MSLSYREKQRFFSQLAQLLRSGSPLPRALETLRRTARGATASVVRALQKKLQHQVEAADAFAELSPALGAMERATLSAAARSGRLDAALGRLADYFEALHRARRALLRQSAYPLFILHFGILGLHVQSLVMGGGLQEYLRLTLPTLLKVWGVIGACAVLFPLAGRMGGRLAVVDSFLRDLPLIGRIRTALAVSRFCGTYDMQLEAGVNVISSVQAAAEASNSGLIHWAVRRALPHLRQGGAPAALLSEARGAFPREAMESLVIAEETGELHRTLPEMQKEYQDEGLHGLDILAEWLPRLLYVGILVWVGWRIVSFYQDVYGGLMRQIGAP